MGLVVEYAIGFEHLPFVDVACELPHATLHVEMVPSADGNIPFVLRATTEDDAAVERVLDDAAFVGEWSALGHTGETHRYQVIPADSLEKHLGDRIDDVDDLRALASTESTIEWIRVTTSGWIQRGWFADRETLEEFRTFWQRNGEFTLRHLERDVERGDPADGLTDPQRAAVQTAYEMGYFEIPRTASLDDVAGELGITASSLSERLRRAQTHLIEETVASSGSRSTMGVR